jgi:LuxR family maltose regulon positive regulatory protein
MQSARAAVAPGVPTYLVTRPSPGSRDVARGVLQDRLDSALHDHRLCVLLAPAGHGKTSLLSAWVGRTPRSVAWLSLTGADRHPEHLARGLAAAVGELEAGAGPSPVLVIDDVHLAGAGAARAVLRPFVENPPLGVRLVLAGRNDPGLGLSRLLAAGDLALLNAADLSFTAEEVRDVAHAVGTELSPARAAALHGLTRGWPVAVRLALLASSPADVPIEPAPSGDIPQLPEYLLESVLADLPGELSDVVLRACVCDWLTSSLVDDLLERTDGAAMLERAVAAGLPLERRDSPGAEPVYRWHPLMAASGRALLQRRSPLGLRELQRRAARALAAHDPVEAAGHALDGRDPGLASALMRSQWLAAVLRGDSTLVEELCGRLPSPYSDDPEILAIRAACLRNADDAVRAAELDRRARDRVGPGTEPRMLDLTLSLARLFVLDSGDELAAESGRARELLAELREAGGPLRACALLLIGWTELRLRHAGLAVPLLREAAASCRAEGLDDLAGRARANEGFALAFGGDFRGALDLVAAAAPEQESAGWRRADGAIEWFTTGWIQFWTGDAEAATVSFQHAADRGGGLVSYADLARCWLADAVVDARDRRRLGQVGAELDLVPDTTIQGVPWRMYKGVARAGAALLAGRPELSLLVLDDVVAGDARLPAANVLAAELYWVCGQPDRALALAKLLGDDMPAYLRAGPIVIEALAAQRRGERERAHELLDAALSASAPQNLVRPFLVDDRDLTVLLAEHPAWGTRHQDLVATALTRRSLRVGQPGGRELTGREREVLGRLSTTMDVVEIAAALHISPNTMKTHLKSIYRKLGVAGRREAVRAAHLRGAAGAGASGPVPVDTGDSAQR